MNKAQQLHHDIAHDAPMSGSQTFLDTRTIEFYNDSRDAKPMSVASYKIVDGTLRVWLTDKEWNDNSNKPVMEGSATL